MNNLITLEQAIAMTTLYRAQKDTILADAYKGKNILSISETFDKDAFQAILDQQACASVRIYFGMSEDLIIRNIIVGVDAEGNDLLPDSSDTMKEASITEGSEAPPPPIVEEGIICPPICPKPSKLNP